MTNDALCICTQNYLMGKKKVIPTLNMFKLTFPSLQKFKWAPMLVTIVYAYKNSALRPPQSLIFERYQEKIIRIIGRTSVPPLRTPLLITTKTFYFTRHPFPLRTPHSCRAHTQRFSHSPTSRFHANRNSRFSTFVRLFVFSPVRQYRHRKGLINVSCNRFRKQIKCSSYFLWFFFFFFFYCDAWK